MTNPTLSPKDVAELRAKRDAAAQRGDHAEALAINDGLLRLKEKIADPRQWIVDLIHNEYDKAPDHYSVHDNWDDGSGRIADTIVSHFAALASQSLEREGEIRRAAIEECAKAADETIKDVLDRWFGVKYATYPRQMIDGIKAITSLESSDERQRAANALEAFFCIHCGAADINCQCWNDQ